MTSVLDTPSILSTGAGGPEGRPSALASDAPHRVRIASQGSSGSELGSAESRTFELVRTFLEHLAAKSASSGNLESAFCSRPAIDWAAVEAAIDGSLSLEKAVGRGLSLPITCVEAKELALASARSRRNVRWLCHPRQRTPSFRSASPNSSRTSEMRAGTGRRSRDEWPRFSASDASPAIVYLRPLRSEPSHRVMTAPRGRTG